MDISREGPFAQRSQNEVKKRSVYIHKLQASQIISSFTELEAQQQTQRINGQVLQYRELDFLGAEQITGSSWGSPSQGSTGKEYLCG